MPSRLIYLTDEEDLALGMRAKQLGMSATTLGRHIIKLSNQHRDRVVTDDAILTSQRQTKRGAEPKREPAPFFDKLPPVEDRHIWGVGYTPEENERARGRWRALGGEE